MRRLVVLSIIALSAFIIAAQAVSGVPHLINYQGILTDTGGTPLDGTYDLTFTIYPDSSQSATPLWTEIHASVVCEEGLFNVILGGVNPMSDSLFNEDERWIGIAIDSDPEIYPRMRITSVPWALKAASADSAGNVEWHDVSNIPSGFADGVDDFGGAGDGHSLDAADGSPVDAVYVDNDGKVGIGTATPSRTLEVDGSVYINTTLGDNLYLTNGANAMGYITHPSSAFPGGSSSGLAIRAELGNDIAFGIGSLQKMVIDSTGNVGIGTITPSEMLDVAGTVKATAFEGDGSGLTGVTVTETDPTVLASVKDGVDWSEVSGIPADIADGDDDTHLTEAEVDAFVANDGYLTSETDPTVLASVKDGVSWGEVTDIPVGFADGIDDTGSGDGHSLDAADGSPTDAVYVDDEGNVGIGTTTPDSRLEVSQAGSETVLSLTGYDDALPPADTDLARIRFGTDYNLVGGYGTRAAITARTTELNYEPATALRFYTAMGDADVTEKMVIMPNGNIGIGTTSPDTKLDIEHSTISEYTAIAVTNLNGSVGSDVSIKMNPASITGAKMSAVAPGGNDADLAFYTVDNLSASEVVRITGDGNVGIGITTPVEKLDIDGNLKVGGTITTDTIVRYYSVPACAFRPALNTQTYTNNWDGLRSNEGNSNFFAEVCLPHGATVIELKSYVTDSDGTWDVYALFTRFAMGSYENDLCANVVSVGAPGVSEWTDTTIDYSTIDNENYSYAVALLGLHNDDLVFHSVRITYTINEPLP